MKEVAKLLKEWQTEERKRKGLPENRVLNTFMQNRAFSGKNSEKDP